MKSLRKDSNAMMFQLLIVAGMSIIIFFAIMNIGVFVNSTIGQNINDQINSNEYQGGTNTIAGGLRNQMNNTTINLSNDFDDVLDSLTIAAIVMAITLPLAAIIAIRKFF